MRETHEGEQEFALYTPLHSQDTAMLALVYPAVISLVPTPAPQTTSFGCSRRAALATGLATSLAALPAPSLASGEDTAGNFMKEGSQTGASSPSAKIGASGSKDTLYGVVLGDSPSGDVIDLMWFADAKTGAHQLLRRAAGHLVRRPQHHPAQPPLPRVASLCSCW